ncbi:MAG: electron transfer flavoprotein subunit beta/FixA family protein [Deltaproteobacteria bacterium]|nr:electron transfer flavoprotein subunit beta/FixA family protein [Deltaproteobacteria bacterium]
MKLLVTIKRVEDPEIKIKVKADGSGIETEQMKYAMNPFDEIAVEEALRLRDQQQGEVVIVSIGNQEAQQQIRSALAMGADRGIHVTVDQNIDPLAAATVLSKIAAEEKPDLILLGKQAVDDDMGQVGTMLAEKLGWGQASFASKEENLESEAEKNKVPAIKIDNNNAIVIREVDGGLETVSITMPAVVTTDLRLCNPRLASLPGIMKAKKKEIKARTLAEFGISDNKVQIIKMEAPKQRQAGIQVPDVATLVEKLHNEAKVI